MWKTILDLILDPNNKSGPNRYTEFSNVFSELLKKNPTMKIPYKEMD